MANEEFPDLYLVDSLFLGLFPYWEKIHSEMKNPSARKVTKYFFYTERPDWPCPEGKISEPSGARDVVVATFLADVMLLCHT
jgi:hypothetical protein